MVRWRTEGSLWRFWSCRGVSPVMGGLRILSFLPHPLFSTTHYPSFTSVPFFVRFVSSPSTSAYRTSRCSTPRTILRFLSSMSLCTCDTGNNHNPLIFNTRCQTLRSKKVLIWNSCQENDNPYSAQGLLCRPNAVKFVLLVKVHTPFW